MTFDKNKNHNIKGQFNDDEARSHQTSVFKKMVFQRSNLILNF